MAYFFQFDCTYPGCTQKFDTNLALVRHIESSHVFVPNPAAQTLTVIDNEGILWVNPSRVCPMNSYIPYIDIDKEVRFSFDNRKRCTMKPRPPRVTINDLPDTCLKFVFRYISSPELRRMRCVSKSWRTVISEHIVERNGLAFNRLWQDMYAIRSAYFDVDEVPKKVVAQKSPRPIKPKGKPGRKPKDTGGQKREPVKKDSGVPKEGAVKKGRKPRKKQAALNQAAQNPTLQIQPLPITTVLNPVMQNFAI